MLINRLPQLMEEKGISIRQLSRETGVTYTTIRALYHGQRRSVQLAVLDAVCEALGIQPGDIYEYQPADDRRPATKEKKSTGPVSQSRVVRKRPQPPDKNDGPSDWRSW